MSKETKHTPGPWEWDGIDPEWLVQSGTAESVLFVVDTRDGGRIKVRDRDKPLIGTSIEDQQRADERMPKLLEIPAQVRFLSCEPLLGPVILRTLNYRDWEGIPPESWNEGVPEGIHWAIVGGESGTNARPMHPDWARLLRDQCQDAGIPFFFKQWGEWVGHTSDDPQGLYWKDGRTGAVIDRHLLPDEDGRPDVRYYLEDHNLAILQRKGKKRAGRLLDGREWNEVPMLTPSPSEAEKMEGAK
ncbi:MAG: DUF5131 family protein [Verrucomicrobiota bacterium]